MSAGVLVREGRTYRTSGKRAKNIKATGEILFGGLALYRRKTVRNDWPERA